MSLLGELKRRNVFRVAMFYAVASWVLLQVGDLLFYVMPYVEGESLRDRWSARAS